MSLHNSASKRRRIRKLLVAAYGPHCMRCDQEKRRIIGGLALTLDHVIPVRDGGSDWPINLQLLCVPCHREVDHLREGGQQPDKDDYRPGLGHNGDCPSGSCIYFAAAYPHHQCTCPIDWAPHGVFRVAGICVKGDCGCRALDGKEGMAAPRHEGCTCYVNRPA